MKWGSLENELGEGRVEINMIKKILIRSSKQDERRRSIKKKFLFLPQPDSILLFIYFFLRHDNFDYQIF